MFYDRNPKSMRTVPGVCAAGRDSVLPGKIRSCREKSGGCREKSGGCREKSAEQGWQGWGLALVGPGVAGQGWQG